MAMSRAFLLAFAASASAAVIVTSSEVLVAERQAPASPVFTVQQATAGKAVYAKSCASCHMPDLSGNGEISALAGPTLSRHTDLDACRYCQAAIRTDVIAASRPPGIQSCA